MPIEIITAEDLERFRIKLLQDLKDILGKSHISERKQYLKSTEVRKMMKISANTLQKLRINGLLHPTKIGGSMYYSIDEIDMLLKGK
jgi:Helix-turn-helix domain